MPRPARAACTTAVLLAASLTACAPVVTHGPRVQPGPEYHVTLGSVRPLCDTGCTADVIPAWAAGFRYGFVPADPARPAALLGLSLPFFDPGSPEADLYLEAPGRGGDAAYGAGVLTSPRHLMPYVQFGSTPERRVGWYATPAYAWTFRHDEWSLDGDVSEDEFHRPPRYWAPAVAVTFPTGKGTVDVYLAGAFGSVIRNVHVFPDDPDQELVVNPVRRPIRTLMVGLTLRATRIALPRVPPPPQPRPRP